jgi:four helix bundle protein
MFFFEKMDVYKKAEAFHSAVYQFLKGNPPLPGYLRDQFGRAALSISLNIAEGSGRFSNKDRRNFYVMARSSAFECAAITKVLLVEKAVPDATAADWTAQLENISKALFGMIRNLDPKEQ